MRRNSGILALALVVSFAVSACGGSSASDTVNNAIANASRAASAAASAASANAGETTAAGGSVDCSGITKDDAAKFLVWTQVLAQVTSPDNVAAIKAKQISDYTPEAMTALLGRLAVLKGHPAAGLADPADSLDFFAKANDLVAAMVAADAPTSAQLAEYATATGGVAGVIGKQLPVNAALGQYCKF